MSMVNHELSAVTLLTQINRSWNNSSVPFPNSIVHHDTVTKERYDVVVRWMVENIVFHLKI